MLAGLQPDDTSYGALIKAYANQKRIDDAFKVYAAMRARSIIPSQVRL
jgi:pentatricopeptide repeat protein